MKKLVFAIFLAFAAIAQAQPTVTARAISAGPYNQYNYLTLTFSESVSFGAGGSGGITLSATNGAVTAAMTDPAETTVPHVSGLPGTTATYRLSRAIRVGETVTVSYTQPGNGLEATSGGADVASFSGAAVTNGSTLAVGGYVYNLHNCDQVTFEKASYRGEVWNGTEFAHVKYLEAGDTIVLPAGAATWGILTEHSGDKRTSLQVAGVTVRGQSDNTVITMSEGGPDYLTPVISLQAPNCTWGWMKFIMPVVHDVGLFHVTASGVRISHVTRIQLANPDPTPGHHNGSGYFLYQLGVTGTLVDNCTITSEVGNDEWIFTRGPSDAWQQNSPIGTSQVDVFVEDCTFNGGAGYSDANSNARHVFRFNTVGAGIKFDAHGVASNSPARSFRSVEYYNNTWVGSGTAFEIRGGTGMVFNNTAVGNNFYLTDYSATGTWPNHAWVHSGQGNILALPNGANTIITTPVAHNFVTGMPVWHGAFGGGGVQVPVAFHVVTVIDATTYTIPVVSTAGEMLSWLQPLNTPYVYPIFDQIGTGKDGGPREPMYVWGNKQGGSSWPRTIRATPSEGIAAYRAQTGNPTATYTERDIIAPNRDFFADSGFDTSTGVSVGTRAAMDAFTPSIVGYGWWVTDEGSWNQRVPPNTSGRLYKWSGSSWVLSYTPYTYPHPLQTSLVCDMPTPSVPSGTYEYPQSVTLTPNPIDATIRYTTDGSVPDHTNGILYSGTPISVTTATTIKAIAYKTGIADSPIQEVSYVITGQVFAPTSNKATGDFHGDQSVTFSTATAGAQIFYTVDGTTPTASSTLYTGAFTVSTTTTLKAIAIKSGLADSSVLTVAIAILLEVGNWDDSASAFNQGTYPSWARQGLAHFTASVTGNLTRISVAGTNVSSTLDFTFGVYEFTGAEGVWMPGTLTLVGSPAVFNDVGTWTDSWKHFDVNIPVVVGHRYWIQVAASESSWDPKGTFLSYSEGYRWTNPGAYTDAWPSTQGIGTNVDGWAVHVKGMLTPSDAVNQPTFSPVEGTYSSAQSVTISSATSGAEIRFTTNGSLPTSGSTLFSSPVAVTSNTTLKAIAYKSGLTDSQVSTANYTITGAPPPVAPTITARTINTAGTTLTLTGSASLSIGAGGSTGFAVTASGGAVTATYASGAPGTSVIYTLSRTIYSSETVTLAYTQPTNGLEATSDGTDLATFSGASVTNGSTQTPPVAPPAGTTLSIQNLTVGNLTIQ